MFFVNTFVENDNYTFSWSKHEIHAFCFRKINFYVPTFPIPSRVRNKKLISVHAFKGPSVQIITLIHPILIENFEHVSVLSLQHDVSMDVSTVVTVDDVHYISMT